MNAPVLDTLRCAQTLKAAGFRDEQAEAMAQILGDALTDVATKADLDNAVGGLKADISRLDRKIDATSQALAAFETSTQRQFEGVQRQLDSFADQLRFQARVTYVMLGVLATLVLGSLVAPHLSWGGPGTTPPNATESPAPGIHSTPAQTRTEAQPLANPTATPPPPPSP